MDLLMKEKNEILISRNCKIQALSEKTEDCEMRKGSRLCGSRLQTKFQESIRSISFLGKVCEKTEWLTFLKEKKEF